MSENVEDLRGFLVSVGDRIAYAVRQGDTAALRVGTILEIIPKHRKKGNYSDTPTKIRVQCEADGSHWGPPSKPTLIEARLKRFVKVEA